MRNSKTKIATIKVSIENSKKKARLPTVDKFEEEIKEFHRIMEESKKKRRKEDQKKTVKDEDQVDSDENLASYQEYTISTISLFYLPFITLLIWQFYDETSISPQWSIKKKDFFFYFLFAVVIIPFQMTIDILCFNIMTYYREYDYLDSLKKWNQGRRQSLTPRVPRSRRAR